MEQNLNHLADPRFEQWLTALESRHLADLTFSQASSALRALSSTYVERRQRLRTGAALEGAGKRAAFALFYGPLHYLLVREIVRSVTETSSAPLTLLIDLGCGTGASGAAWASARNQSPEVVGFDRHPWAVAEARETYRAFGLRARTGCVDVARAKLPRRPASILAAFLLNELHPSARDVLMQQLLDRAARGDQVLVVEPIAGAAVPWWNAWRAKVERAGGRSDEWRLRIELPPIVAKLDRAAGLDHRALTGRSFWLAHG